MITKAMKYSKEGSLYREQKNTVLTVKLKVGKMNFKNFI